ncbi:hypothetical protein SAMN05216327_101265 [Dyadobacter sp. SG02]|uniref:ATP-binding protein n=1 Tax=Dyadobacter sp. SG02 TaxID=1855291 RepID=UPI0008B39476|nr:ATP-binding protein [Dyadobacter sp. SG02]SEI40238.1 hypothetical protein SAMN05216327_101265 [Dyadobacter sp. SG02]
MTADKFSQKQTERKSDEFDYATNSQIKKIYLQIPGGYKYRHQSLKGSEDGFLGRRQIIDSFTDILKSQTRKGVYLVTGYRGMGKTSFVKQVLAKLGDSKVIERAPGKQHIEETVKIKTFFISLAQSQLKDIDILKHIVNQLLSSLEDTPQYRIARWSSLGNVFGWLWPLITILLISINFYLVHSVPGDDSKTVIENLVGIATLAAILAMFLHKLISWINSKLTAIVRSMRIWVVVSALFWSVLAIIFVLTYIPELFLNLDWVFESYEHFGIPELNPILSIQALAVVVTSAGLIMASIKYISTIEKCVNTKIPISRLHERLKILHDRCNAQVTKEDQLQDSFAMSMSSLFNKHQKVYPIANPREIENELIDIIGNLKEYYQYIFVFDELDKVDPDFENVESLSEQNAGKVTFLNDLRERRYLITSILASLKYFINEAEAKFIFIAGREMFEAALADISDRQSSISSIFHKVIYVDSFLKDRTGVENQVSAIGGLVEDFLNSILLSGCPKGRDFFSQYYKILTEGIVENHEDEEIVNNVHLPALTKQQARKVIFTLQNFVGYLVYRSNGSPKKITKILEEYICEMDCNSSLTESGKSILVNIFPPEQNTHYLSFSYLDQYRLGYTAYLFQPFLTINSSFMKRYSDNTLVSISYLIDNLIKFHPFAFSAQNLELLPEILATSRTPVSRPFLEELVSFLAQNHIRRTESGLYEYKFHDRTHNEITYISKLFEDEAAAFNFTLDETFSIKAHLQAKIRHLRLVHSSSNNQGPVVSIVFLNRLLGDARFQDEEYQDAIISYQDALHMLNPSGLLYANQITSFMLLKLKLGLTYEKIKAYEFALGHYAGVIEEGSKILLSSSQKHEIIYRELMLIMMQAFLATLYLQEKLQEGITFQKIKHNVDRFVRLLRKFKHDYENRDILMASYFGGIGTALYFKNMVLPQKINEVWMNSIKHPSVQNMKLAIDAITTCFSIHIPIPVVEESERELRAFMDRSTSNSDARISIAAYIYYKISFRTLLGSSNNSISDLLGECPKLISPRIGENVTYRSLQHTRRLNSFGHILAKIGDFLLPVLSSDGIDVSEALGCFYFVNSESELRKNQIFESRARLFKSYFQNRKSVNGDWGEKIHPRFLIHLYYLSALFYLEGGDRSNAVFQMRKILFVLRSVRLTSVGVEVYEALRCLEFNLIRRILELSSLMSHSSDRPQLGKYKDYFDIHTSRTPHEFSNELYGSLSNNPDTKETILAYAILRMKYFKFSRPKSSDSLEEQFRSIPEHKLLSPYNSMSHQITRLMELDLHTRCNRMLMDSYLAKTIRLGYYFEMEGKDRNIPFRLFGRKSHWENYYFHDCKLYDVKRGSFFPVGPKKDSVRRIEGLKKSFEECADKEVWFDEYVGLVLNSIFNLIQMKRIVNTFGHNYILSYSFFAKIHMDLGSWLKHLHLCRIIEPTERRGNLDKRLIDLIGFQDSIGLDALTEYQMAAQYYYFALQMHKEGTIYRNRMNNLIYLEDDFNDNLYHFGAGLERLQINSEAIRRKIGYLKADLHKANMYKYTTFIGDSR